MKKSLIERKGNRFLSKTIKIFDSPEMISALTSKLAWDILNLISIVPMYPNDIAKKLKVHEQKVYYHINKMRKAGIVEVTNEREKNGAMCRYFSPTSHAFGVELPGNESEIKFTEESSNPILRDIFSQFSQNGIFNGSLVVGSPNEHGPYLTYAKDGHYSAQLSMFLGSIMKTGKRNIIKLDTEVKSERAEDRNMIVIGGPITNMITNDLNNNLEINFKWTDHWSLYSKETKNNYKGDHDALIAIVNNPWDTSKKIILLSGIKSEGTKTAIIALTQFYEKVFKNLNEKKDFYAVIRGLDKDGDGKVDDIRILETKN